MISSSTSSAYLVCARCDRVLVSVYHLWQQCMFKYSGHKTIPVNKIKLWYNLNCAFRAENNLNKLSNSISIMKWFIYETHVFYLEVYMEICTKCKLNWNSCMRERICASGYSATENIDSTQLYIIQLNYEWVNNNRKLHKWHILVR